MGQNNPCHRFAAVRCAVCDLGTDPPLLSLIGGCAALAVAPMG
jgi:hypothetical protein